MQTTDRNPAFWRRHARRYDRSVELLNRGFRALASAIAKDLAKCERVLEVGAGTGLVTIELARVARTLVATDRSPEMLEVLRARLRDGGQRQGVEVIEADVHALTFPGGSFDAVVAANLLHLLREPGRALDEIRRVLRPGGMLCAPTFAHGETLLAAAVSRLLSLAGFPVVTRFGGATLRQLIERHGFEVVREDLVRGILPIRYVLARAAEDRRPDP